MYLDPLDESVGSQGWMLLCQAWLMARESPCSPPRGLSGRQNFERHALTLLHESLMQSHGRREYSAGLGDSSDFKEGHLRPSSTQLRATYLEDW
jgi:hypothetical protein